MCYTFLKFPRIMYMKRGFWIRGFQSNSSRNKKTKATLSFLFILIFHCSEILVLVSRNQKSFLFAYSCVSHITYYKIFPTLSKYNGNEIFN